MSIMLCMAVTAAAIRLPAAMQRLEAVGRPALQKYLDEQRAGAAVQSIEWLDVPAGAAMQHRLWRAIADAEEHGISQVLAVPRIEASAAAALLDLPEDATEGVHLSLLPPDAPVPAVVIDPPAAWRGSERRDGAERRDEAAALERSRAWVQRTLAPGALGFCPYTASASEAGAGLESLGVTAAPIAFGVSSSAQVSALVADFWRMVEGRMLGPGEGECSSILLMAPAWDGRWEEWKACVFPTLEATLVASGLSRTFGIVCFHPCYLTPDAEYLARHRFGHMHSTGRLRRWHNEVDETLSRSLSDDEVHWVGSYQRRSPHATINVLWSRQLEIAETRRDSASLYTRNLRRAVRVGFEQLHGEAQAERGDERGEA